MLRCSSYLAVLLMLRASLVQTAPVIKMGLNLWGGSGNWISYEFPLGNKVLELEIPEQQALIDEKLGIEMVAMQVNLLKILLILNVASWICIYWMAREECRRNVWIQHSQIV